MRVTVLGAGMVGRTIATDLSAQFDVTVADVSEANLEKLTGVKVLCTDLSLPHNIITAVKNADIVVGAVPGFMGYQTLKCVIAQGKPCVDISFFNEDPFTLNELARQHNVPVIIDCGVAPGLDNILLGHHAPRMSVTHFVCYVGGLPVARTLPFQYKAPFSPIDVIEEYTRQARWVVDGTLVTQPALTEPEILDFDNIGSLIAFNTDGLRTLIHSFPDIPFMKEKTLRYPGHIELMQVFRDAGFFNKEAIVINNVSVSPLDLTSHLLFKHWQYAPGEKEFTVMRVIVEGREDDIHTTYTYNLYDVYDSVKMQSSMSRTTGFTCAAAAHLLARNIITRAGIYAPEDLGRTEACFAFIMDYLKERGVNINRTKTTAA